ncbi:MAG: hypothetical protein IKP40_10285 [Clostridia bacterium]|nr:hypothetical protein [Clostridia bacterium]
MANYTIEDIENLRRLSGISYQEAIALLDYHNGDVARALADWEKNGRRKQPEPERPRERQEKKDAPEGLWKKLYAARLTVRKGDSTVLNVSSICAGISLIICPYIVLGGAVASLALGYKIGFEPLDSDFVKDDVGDLMRKRASQVRRTVDNVARQFSGQNQGSPKEMAHDAPEVGRREHSAPVIQMPVKVDSQDGFVSVSHEEDGFTSATIE